MKNENISYSFGCILFRLNLLSPVALEGLLRGRPWLSLPAEGDRDLLTKNGLTIPLWLSVLLAPILLLLGCKTKRSLKTESTKPLTKKA